MATDNLKTTLKNNPELAFAAFKNGEIDSNYRINGVPVLSVALSHDNLEIARELIAQGADVNAYAKGPAAEQGMAPIHFANSKETIELLASAKANIDAPYKDVDHAWGMRGETALHTAALGNTAKDQALADALVKAGANQTLSYGKEYEYGKNSNIGSDSEVVRGNSTIADRLEMLREKVNGDQELDALLDPISGADIQNARNNRAPLVEANAPVAAPPIADTEALKAIEIRAEQRAGGLSIVGSDKQMAESDVADFQNISAESGLQRFAAVQITDNINDYPDYKTSFENAASQHPGLSEKVAEFYVLDNAMSAAKEGRKAAEMQSMTQDAQSVSKTPGAPVAESESQLDIDKAMLRAIELRGESISAENEPDSAEKHRSAAVADVSDFQKISDPNYQRFAADQIGNNCYDSGAYKAAFEAIAASHPGLAEKVTALDEINAGMSSAKDARKAAEMQSMTQAAQSGIDPAALERVAVTRAQDSAQAREALGLNTVELNIEKKQQKLAGEAETNRSAWLKKAEDAKAVQATDTPKQASENKINSDEMFTTEKNADVKPVIPPEIESQYLRTGDKFYHPKTPELVAFEDKGHKLETKSDSEKISQNLVKIAQARGWDEIKISGSEKFRQEVWLEASARGMEVKGYTPTDLDKAQLAKRVSEIGANKIEKANIPFRGRENEAGFTAQSSVKSDASAIPVLVAHGAAKYLNDEKNTNSYFVTTSDENGKEKTSWGVDLGRAVNESGAKIGDKVLVANEGKKEVTIDVKVRDEDGKVIRTEKKDTFRNTWNVQMAESFANESPAEALKKYPQLAGAVAMASAIDKQAEAAGLTPEQRAIGAARVRQNLTNSIERGDIPPPVKILVPVEVKNEAKEDREFAR